MQSTVNAFLFCDNQSSETGHFFVMIREKQGKIGCAAAIYKTKEWNYNFLFTCNYEETNMSGEKVYEVGSQCLRCSQLGSGFKCGVQ